MTRATRILAFVALACLTALSSGATADEWRLRLEGGLSGTWAAPNSLDTALGFQNRFTKSGSARLMWEGDAGGFHFDYHSLVTARQGGDVSLATALSPFLPASPPSTLFNLTQTLYSSADTTVTHRIDRLSAAWSSPNVVLRAGRQAITWGGGMVFHPSDIVAPFAPDAIDTSYKPGADMVYAQYLFDSGADIQAIAVPRALTFGGPVTFATSTYALRGQTQLSGIDASAMVARDRGDFVGSLGLSGPLGGASWNAEYVHWKLSGGATYPTWLVNISNFGSIGEWTIAYYAEYYHNGFGVAGTVPLDSLPASLTKRMGTGQVFLAGRDFLSLGANVQITPDLAATPNSIISLNDRSVLAGLGFNYTLGDNTNLVFNYFQPFGSLNTVFGGRQTSAGSGIYAGPARNVQLRLVQFF